MNHNATFAEAIVVENPTSRSIIRSVLSWQAFVAILFIFLTRVLYLALFHPLKDIPGPALARVTELWRLNRYLRGTWFEDSLELHKKYGPVVRIAPNEVSVVNATAIKEVFGFGKPNIKTKWYNTFAPPNGSANSFVTQDVPQHRFLRSRVATVYSMTSIMTFEPLITDVVNLNIKKMRRMAKEQSTVMLDKWVGYFTFDVVGQLAIGQPIGCLEQEKDVNGVMNTIRLIFLLSANVGNLPTQMDLINNKFVSWLLKTLGGTPASRFQGFVEDFIEERKRTYKEEKKSDMLQYFVQMKAQDGKPIQTTEIFGEAANIFGAGSDTTTVGILSCLEACIQYPDKLIKLRKEIDEAYESLGLVDQEIDYREASKLPYLNAWVKEAGRIHPSIVYPLPREVPIEGVNVGLHHLPSKTVMSISPGAANRDVTAFGIDADDFKPERWLMEGLNEDEKKDVRVMESCITTFGMGSRNCIGKNIALVEITKYLAAFVRHFDLIPVNKEQPWKMNSYWFAFPEDFQVRFTERSHTFEGYTS